MRNVVAGVLFMVLSAPAAAVDWDDERFEEEPDELTPKLMYQFDFGARGWDARGLALRLDHGDTADAPAVIEGVFTTSGLQSFTVAGLEMVGSDPVLAQRGTMADYMRKLTPTQWLGIGVAAATLGAILFDSGGGGEDARIVGTGGG